MSVVFGGDAKQMDSGKGLVVSVSGDLPKDKVIACAKKAAEEEKEKLEVIEDGQFVQFKGEGESQWVHFSDGGVVFSPDSDKAYLQARVEGKEPVTANKEFMAQIEKVDTGGTMWAAVAGKEPLAGSDSPKGGYGSVRLDSGLKVDMTMAFASAEMATKTATETNQQMEGAKAMPQFAKFIEKVNVAAEGENVNVKVDLGEAEVKEILEMAKAQLPMLLGGGF